jgi:cytochrome c551/c552
MQPAIKTWVVTTVIGAVVAFFMTVATSSLTISSAQATPQIAKGKPCGTCHQGSPPSKSNVKK